MSTTLGVLSPPSSANAAHAGQRTTSDYDDALGAFMSVRSRIFGIAYRMLGSAAEAEDVVQDVWVRWQTADRRVVRDAPAFLATTATRLAINVIQSARVRHETYVEPGLPEPIDSNADPGAEAERSEALELAVQILLEKLSPAERAAYIFREAFDYAYRDIANMLRLSEANARQLVTRARQHVADVRRAPASPAELRRLLDAFVSATRRGDVAGLEGLLASAVTTRLRIRSIAGRSGPRQVRNDLHPRLEERRWRATQSRQSRCRRRAAPLWLRRPQFDHCGPRTSREFPAGRSR